MARETDDERILRYETKISLLEASISDTVGIKTMESQDTRAEYTDPEKTQRIIDKIDARLQILYTQRGY